jgi:Uma2 family endonuclease
VFVVPLEDARTLEWARMKTLLLAVEVLSRSTPRADRFTKRRLYREVGVSTYWIVDPGARYVEVWTPDVAFPIVERDVVMWQPPAATHAFTLQVGDRLRPI